MKGSRCPLSSHQIARMPTSWILGLSGSAEVGLALLEERAERLLPLRLTGRCPGVELAVLLVLELIAALHVHVLHPAKRILERPYGQRGLSGDNSRDAHGLRHQLGRRSQLQQRSQPVGL